MSQESGREVKSIYSDFSYFDKVSSCAVEILSSQIKLICDTCGDNIMEYMVQIRMFEHCNGDLRVVFDD